MRLLGISCDANGVEVAAGLLSDRKSPERPEFEAFVSVRREGSANVSDIALALVDEVLVGLAHSLALPETSPAAAADALDGLVFNAGPGGFTAVRSACALAQGLALGWSKPVAALSSLEAWAEPLLLDADLCDPGLAPVRALVLLDARMGELYCGLFSIEHSETSPCLVLQKESVMSPAALDEWLAPVKSSDDANSAPCFLLGDFQNAYPELLASLEAKGWTPRLSPRLQLQSLMRQVWRKGHSAMIDAALVGPHYVRDKVALNAHEQQALRETNARLAQSSAS